jgi:hypothetical protein
VPVISLSWYNDKIEVKFLCPALCTVSNTICTWRLFDKGNWHDVFVICLWLFIG